MKDMGNGIEVHPYTETQILTQTQTHNQTDKLTCTERKHGMQYTVQHIIGQYSIVQYSSVQYNIVKYKGKYLDLNISG